MTNKEWDELSSQTVPFWMSIGDRKGRDLTITLYDKKKVISDNEFLLNKSIRLIFDGLDWKYKIYTKETRLSIDKMFKDDEFTSVPTYSKSIDYLMTRNIIKSVFEGSDIGGVIVAAKSTGFF